MSPLQTKILNTKEAVELYTLLNPYLPKEFDEEDLLSFAGTILEGMIDLDRHGDYLHAVEILCEEKYAYIVTLEIDEIFQAFVEGLLKNEFFTLVKFCRELGYGSS